MEIEWRLATPIFFGDAPAAMLEVEFVEIWNLGDAPKLPVSPPSLNSHLVTPPSIISIISVRKLIATSQHCWDVCEMISTSLGVPVVVEVSKDSWHPKKKWESNTQTTQRHPKLAEN